MGRLIMCALTMALVCACAEDEEDAELCPLGYVYAEEAGCTFDELAVGNAMTRFEYAGFTKANAAPFTQQFGPSKQRNIWVSVTAVDIGNGVTDSALRIYARLDPENPAATISGKLPVGTMLIHQGADPPFGVMLKREQGFNVAQNDWWFGRFHRDGTPEPIEQGPYGQTCMECHVRDDRQSRTDLLWGVPRASL